MPLPQQARPSGSLRQEMGGGSTVLSKSCFLIINLKSVSQKALILEWQNFVWFPSIETFTQTNITKYKSVHVPSPLFLFNDFKEIITKLKMGHVGGCGVRLCSTNLHLLLVTFNPFYERLMLLSWALLLAKSLSPYFQLITEALKCCSHGPRPWRHTDFILALPSLPCISGPLCISFFAPTSPSPSHSFTQTSRMFFLIYSFDPVLLLLKNVSYSLSPIG